jgi:hypothetical protein
MGRTDVRVGSNGKACKAEPKKVIIELAEHQSELDWRQGLPLTLSLLPQDLNRLERIG